MSVLVAHAVTMSSHPLGDVEVTVDVPDDLPDLEGEPVHLRHALLAVLVSAMDALGDAALVAFAHEHGLDVVAKPFDDLAGLAALVRDAASA